MTIGILGGGQLGRMLALAGYPLDLKFRIIDPQTDASAAQVAADTIACPFEDQPRLAEFARGVDVVTYEFENVPVETARFIAQFTPVYPPPAALDVAQDRLHEKTLFRKLGIPTPEFAPVQSASQLTAALQKIGIPAVLKTRRMGYDGKGQAIIRSLADADSALQSVGTGIDRSTEDGLPPLHNDIFSDSLPPLHNDVVPLILEAFVPFDRELSILAVRSRSGATAFYPLVENHHRAGILRKSIAPAPRLTSALQNTAEDYANRVLTELNYVGVLAIEWFEFRGALLANEMAPRVHNSGHWTIEGARTSQFENHLRAILDLPLGDCAATGSAVMLNLIGRAPSAADLLSVPGSRVHLYGKSPRPGRKIGHITVCGPTEAAISPAVTQLEALLGP